MKQYLGGIDMKDVTDIKKKKGLKLLSKMLMAVTIPLVALVVLAGVSLEAVGSKVAGGDRKSVV